MGVAWIGTDGVTHQGRFRWDFAEFLVICSDLVTLVILMIWVILVKLVEFVEFVKCQICHI